MKKGTVLVLVITISILSCSNPKQSPLPPYFDLQGYINGQVKTLTANKYSIVKNVSVNEKKEEHPITLPDWKQELQPFIDADINKPSWRGNFNVDTVYEINADTEKVVTYTTAIPDIRTKKLALHYDVHTGVITEIEIHNLTDNVLYHFEQQLFYFPMKKYFISTSEKVVLLNPSVMKIDGSIQTN